MVPSISPISPDFWQNDLPEIIALKCLMPNGLVIILDTIPNATLKEIKEELWFVSQKNSLHRVLKEKSMYVISAISSLASLDEYSNESKRLCDVQPYYCTIRIAEKSVSTKISSDAEITKDIGNLIGKCVDDFSALKSLEVNDFRYKMSHLGAKIAEERNKMTWIEKLLYQYPPRLTKLPTMPDTLKGRLRNNNTFVIVVKLENDETSFSFNESCYITPDILLEKVLEKMKMRNYAIRGDRHDFILKVCGRDEYIFQNHPLIQFSYIQEELSRDGVPNLIMKFIQNLDIFQFNVPYSFDCFQKSNYNMDVSTMLRMKTQVSSWSIEDMFAIKLHSIDKINCDLNRTVVVGLCLGLYHGEQSLCARQIVPEIAVKKGKALEINEEIVFDIQIQNMPRMARLCLVIYEVTKSTKVGGSKAKKYKDGKELGSKNPLAWVNTTIFDYKHQLKSGNLILYTWTYADDIQADELLHYLGTVESNPQKEECAAINLTFHNYGCKDPIVFPSEDTVLEYAEKVAQTKCLNRDSAQEIRTIKEILAPYLSNDRSHEMHDQERNAIWAKRLDCLNDAPEGLPFLLHCIEWKNRDEVSEMSSLLKRWPKLSIERSLELLDYAYADLTVRGFAVNCLRELRDEELLLYLLQLVQAIKHESYLDCELVEFLLTRALRNQRIGHYFFWHLRSEMQVPAMQTRFGLILEAYLKGSQSHVPLLLKQVHCLEKLKQCSEITKKGSKEKFKTQSIDFLMNEKNKGIFENVVSPLNPSFRCKTARPEQCKVMDSKMRPLWIVFENSDMHGEDIYIIFKNGDDLRQDMLTLQMLRVMDEIWKDHGLDFRMNIYGCISMERRLGMIEVVLNAETIANIQKEGVTFSATSAFKKGSLLSWLTKHNPDESLEKAINEFTLSCAGYCVATYVLGVADRHSDNIMVKRNGQLFHIDFGHILGHFKEKFGVKRERVPFVLTHDFVYVINKGRTDREAEEFQKFQNLCEKAFLILRQHGCLILSLFAMMVSTGLPELSSEKDLNYLKETLVLDFTEDKAREHFRSKFREALANSWKTSLNWASHNFSKNNKQ